MASNLSLQSYLRLSLFFLLTIFQLASSASYKCSDSNFTTNSTYQSNRNQLLSNLATAGWRTGFSILSHGQAPDQVFGRALCLGSLNSSACQTCLLSATQEIKSNCSHSIRAGMWYDQCFIRYGDTNSTTSDENSWSMIFYNVNNVLDPEKLEQVYSPLMGSLADRAANSTEMFKVGEANYTGSITMYGLVQCIRDISPDDCYNCLNSYITSFQLIYGDKQGGVMLGFRCYTRMDLYTYFNLSLIDAPPPVMPPQLPPSQPKQNSTGNNDF